MLLQAFFIWLRHTLYALNIHNTDTPESESGQGLVEYAIIMVLVSVLVIVLLMILGPAVRNMFENVVRSMGADPS